jgi:hypothetical protein
MRRDQQENRVPRATMGDILAVQLPDGSEALVQAHVDVRCLEYPGYTKDFIRTNVLKPTGPYGILWYISPTGKKSLAYEYIRSPSYLIRHMDTISMRNHLIRSAS